MKRRLAALLSAALVATTFAVFASAQPASADVCAGTGNASVAPGLLYPILPPTVSTGGVTFPNGHTAPASWAFSLSPGVCAPGLGGLSASGTLQGYCGHSVGSGTDTAGHKVSWMSLGTFLILNDEVTGIAQAVPNPAIAGNSCTTGATSFIVTGAANRVNCATQTLTTSLITLIPGTHTLQSGFHLTTPPIFVHTSQHSCTNPTQL